MATNSIKTTSELFPAKPPAPSRSEKVDKMLAHLETCCAVQKRAMSFGKRPFGACLVGPDGEVLLTHQSDLRAHPYSNRYHSVDVVNHAEASLARQAVTHYSLPYLWQCTLYSTWEPCAMCCGTIYWANIGRVVFAASNDTLMALTGADNPQNLGIDLSMRQFIKFGKKNIDVNGPFNTSEAGDATSYGGAGLEGVVKDMSQAYF